LQIRNDTVVVIIGVLAAIAIPAYVGQQERAKDTATQAQLRTAATAQQLHYAEEDAYAADVEALEAHGFRQGDQEVTVASGADDSYCMEAPGGTGDFHTTQDTGKPEPGGCPVAAGDPHLEDPYGRLLEIAADLR
jgi:type IV pilus assembly protein PilA